MCAGRVNPTGRDGSRPAGLVQKQLIPGRVVMKTGSCMIACVVAATSTGCASITQSETQAVSLTASHEGKPVDPQCMLKNDKGSWDAKAPAHVSVKKSSEDLEVTCKKEGMPDGLLKAVSRAAGSMFGNIIFGGGIGAIIDHNKGTGYDYLSCPG
jgi:hypothetical protein